MSRAKTKKPHSIVLVQNQIVSEAHGRIHNPRRMWPLKRDRHCNELQRGLVRFLQLGYAISSEVPCAYSFEVSKRSAEPTNPWGNMSMPQGPQGPGWCPPAFDRPSMCQSFDGLPPLSLKVVSRTPGLQKWVHGLR